MAAESSSPPISMTCGKKKCFHQVASQNIGEFVATALGINGDKIKEITASTKPDSDHINVATLTMPAVMLVRDFGCISLVVTLKEDELESTVPDKSTSTISALDVLM
ncbi:hypothetical protein SNE40_001641 [Patella caerulea]|uniref:Uncharacterized protein n=1 Tax=Patella caerulea TaxID=87958 RepID=A0AAN8QI84_PATCE